MDVVGAAGPEDSAGGIGEVAGEGGEVLRVVPVGVGPVTEAFGPEFEAGKQAEDVRHDERLLEELGVCLPLVVQDGQEERCDAKRSVPAVASPLATPDAPGPTSPWRFLPLLILFRLQPGFMVMFWSNWFGSNKSYAIKASLSINSDTHLNLSPLPAHSSPSVCARNRLAQQRNLHAR